MAQRGPYKEYLKSDDVEIPATTARRHFCVENTSGHHQSFLNVAANRIDTESISNHSSIDIEMTSASDDNDTVSLDHSTDSIDTEPPPTFSSSSSVDGSYTSFSDDDDEPININESFVEANNQVDEDGITQQQSLLLVLAFAHKHNLSDHAVNDLIKLINAHKPHCLPNTKHLFYKSFHHKQFEKHYFCSRCSFYFGVINDQQCPCGDTIELSIKNQTYFAYWPIAEQLSLLLHNKEIRKSLFQANRANRTADTIEDITDGKLFRDLKESHGYESNDAYYSISLLWNIDGVPAFKSNNKDFWPIQCTVNELPVNLRGKHILMPALWFGDHKVNTRLLMTPFIEELVVLSENG